ncbi:MAG: glycosyltransferase family 39 protein [Ignavibacteriae bacterium]|nr:glycosyltransferase family 39 protein [Ignavibacteriota bacterium]
MNNNVENIDNIIIKIKRSLRTYFSSKNEEKIAFFLIFLGIVFRLSQFLFNRSLWPDESSLALNIVERDYLEFLKPLDYHQGAPFGFLIIVKFFINTFGNTDLILRLFPFITSIVGLFLFYKVAKYNLTNRATIIALGLFTFSDPLIYYASEIKQYSNDVTAMLLVLLAAYKVIEKNKLGSYFVFAFTGAILLWFSHPTMFMLAGSGIALGIFYLTNGEKKSLKTLVFTVGFWLLSFAFFYLVSLKYLAHDTYMEGFWQLSFFPRNPFSSKIDFISWYLERPFKIFEHPVGLYFTGLGVITFILGSLEFYKSRKLKFTIIIFPLIVTIAASFMRKYPFNHRLILFLVPIFLMMIANGVSLLFDKKYISSKNLGILVLFLLFLHPVINSFRKLNTPRTRDEIKLAIEFLKENRKKGDTIYLYNLAETGFKYYSKQYGFSEEEYIVGHYYKGKWDDAEKYLGTKRFWIFFTHISPYHPHAKEFYLSFLKENGKELKSFSADGASVYLYDLSQKNSQQNK